jgi:hypothetical protein
MYVTPFAVSANDVRRVLRRAYGTVRESVHRAQVAAGRTLDLVSTRAARYVGARLERGVKPPIVAAIAIAGVALALAALATFRS